MNLAPYRCDRVFGRRMDRGRDGDHQQQAVSQDGVGRSGGNQATGRRDHGHLLRDGPAPRSTRPCYDAEATPEFAKLYGGERTPEQFEAFEDARTENARSDLGSDHEQPGAGASTAGGKRVTDADCLGPRRRDVPVSAAEAYRNALSKADAKLTIYDHCGHRPEIEKSAEFLNWCATSSLERAIAVS